MHHVHCYRGILVIEIREDIHLGEGECERGAGSKGLSGEVCERGAGSKGLSGGM